MKVLAALLFFILVTAASVTAGAAAQQAEREQSQITVEDIPECLHVGDRVEVTVIFDFGGKPSKIDLTVSSEWGKVSATSLLANDLQKSVAVIVRGNKYGRDSITFSVPGRPDITPLTKSIIVLPSFEPPQDLSAQPTDKFMHVAPSGEGGGTDFFRQIKFEWQPKEGVKFFWIQMLDAERIRIGASRAESGADSTTDYTSPGEKRFGRIRAVIGTCNGEDVWAPYGPMVPFDS